MNYLRATRSVECSSAAQDLARLVFTRRSNNNINQFILDSDDEVLAKRVVRLESEKYDLKKALRNKEAERMKLLVEKDRRKESTSFRKELKLTEEKCGRLEQMYSRREEKLLAESQRYKKELEKVDVENERLKWYLKYEREEYKALHDKYKNEKIITRVKLERFQDIYEEEILETRYRYEMLLNGVEREVDRLKFNSREEDGDEDESRSGNAKKGYVDASKSYRVTQLDVHEAAQEILRYNEDMKRESAQLLQALDKFKNQTEDYLTLRKVYLNKIKKNFSLEKIGKEFEKLDVRDMERKIGRPFGLDSRIHTSVGIERRDESLYYFLREKEGKVDVMKIENESLRAEKEEMCAKNERSKSKLKAYQDVIEEKEKKIGDLKAKITETDNSAIEIRRLKEDLKQHKVQIQELQKTLVTKEKEIFRLQKELRKIGNQQPRKDENGIAFEKDTGDQMGCKDRREEKEKEKTKEQELVAAVTDKEKQINLLKFQLQELEKQNAKGREMRQKQHEREMILKIEEIKLLKFEFEQAEKKSKLHSDKPLKEIKLQIEKQQTIEDMLVREEKFSSELEKAKGEIVSLQSELKAKILCVEEKREKEIELEKQILYKNGKIKLHGKELTDMSQRYNNINDKCKDLQSKLEDCKENCKVLQEQLQDQSMKHEREVSNAVNELEERCETLQKKLENEKRLRINESQHPNERAKAQFEIELWEEKCKNVRSEHEKEKSGACEEKCKDSLDDSKEMLAELKTWKENCIKLQEQLDRERKIKENLLSPEIDALKKQIKILESELQGKEVTMNEREKTFELNNMELQQLKDEFANREESMKQNDAKMKQKYDKLNEIEEKHSWATKRIMELEDLLKKEQTQLSEHKLQDEKKISDMEKQIHDLKQVNTQSQVELSDLKLSNSRLLASKKELEKRERISDKQVWNLQEKVYNYEQDIIKNNVILEEQKQINQKQKEQIEFLRKKEREHNAELQKYKNNTKNEEKVNELLNLLAEEKKKVKENEERCRILEEDKKMIIKVVEQKQEQINLLSSQLKESQQSVEEHKKLKRRNCIEDQKEINKSQLEQSQENNKVELEKLRHQLSLAQEELAKLQQEKEILKKEYDNKLYNNKIKIENLQDDKDMLKKKLQKLQDETKNNETETSVLKKKIEHLTKQSSELEKGYLNEKAKVLQSNEITTALNTEIDQLIADKEILQERLENERNAKLTNLDMDEKIKELENEKEERDIQIGELQQALVAQDETIDDLTRMIRQLEFLLEEEHNAQKEKKDRQKNITLTKKNTNSNNGLKRKSPTENQKMHMSPENSDISDEESFGIPLARQFTAHPSDFDDDNNDYYDDGNDHHGYLPDKASQKNLNAGQHMKRQSDDDHQYSYLPNKASQKNINAGQHMEHDSDGHELFVPTLGMLQNLMAQELYHEEYMKNNHNNAPQKAKVTMPPITQTQPLPRGKLAPLGTPAFPSPAGKLAPLAPIKTQTIPHLAPIKKTAPLGRKLSPLDRGKKLPPIKLGKKL
ncbi:trichohyalin-like [Hydractinia symbiolongicarpus]|uniref:trichohyalin-like n=1 Tax=Hydractinia symbiolongicarpus TaxID=13093 RepID=UPI00254C52F7|nr:trichohyalin-like [Hydractinia symbiolongicarpus]